MSMVRSSKDESVRRLAVRWGFAGMLSGAAMIPAVKVTFDWSVFSSGLASISWLTAWGAILGWTFAKVIDENWKFGDVIDCVVVGVVAGVVIALMSVPVWAVFAISHVHYRSDSLTAFVTLLAMTAPIFTFVFLQLGRFRERLRLRLRWLH